MSQAARYAWFGLLALTACGESTPPPSTPPIAKATATAAPLPAPTAAPTASTPAVPEAPKAPVPVVKYTGAFATPESVLYDAANDRYLVSNVNGTPLDLDDNGYIAVLSPDGAVTTPKWIAGGVNKVKLNAPKGLALHKDVLYVADVNTVRMFDAKSGAPKGEVKITGATFLNDVAAGEDGTIYVSDTGLKAGANGFDPTGTDAVWSITKGVARPFSKSPELGRPNGLAVTKDGVWAVSFGSGELYRLDAKGAKHDAQLLPKGSLDGIVLAGDQVLVSSWEGSAIYRGKPGGTFEQVLGELKAPADFGWDSKRSRVLVPRFQEDVVEVYEIK